MAVICQQHPKQYNRKSFINIDEEKSTNLRSTKHPLCIYDDMKFNRFKLNDHVGSVYMLYEKHHLESYHQRCICVLPHRPLFSSRAFDCLILKFLPLFFSFSFVGFLYFSSWFSKNVNTMKFETIR